MAYYTFTTETASEIVSKIEEARATGSSFTIGIVAYGEGEELDMGESEIREIAPSIGLSDGSELFTASFQGGRTVLLILPPKDRVVQLAEVCIMELFHGHPSNEG